MCAFFTELLLNSVVYTKEKLSWHWNENADNFGTIQKMVIHVIFRPLKRLKNLLQNFTLILRHYSCGLLAATVWKVSGACIDCIFGCACVYKWHAHTNMLVWNIWWLFLTLTQLQKKRTHLLQKSTKSVFLKNNFIFWHFSIETFAHNSSVFEYLEPITCDRSFNATIN